MEHVEMQEQVEQVEEQEMVVTLDTIMEAIEQIDEVHHLAQIIKTAVTRQEKLLRGKAKRVVKSEGIPNQLKPNNQWVDFILAHSRENGWEQFEMKQKGEQVEMSEGAQREDGVFVFANTGKEFTRAHAMGLSKFLKDSNAELWTSYQASLPEKPEKQEKPKKTEEEKAQEKAEKEAQKAAQKAQEKAEKEAQKLKEKEEKEAAKALEKAEKEAAKALEKAKEKAEKEAAKALEKVKVPPKAIVVKRPLSVSPVKPAAAPVAAATPVKTPVKAPVKVVALKTPAASEAPVKAPVKTVQAKPVKTVVTPKESVQQHFEEWTVSEGKAKAWTWKGKNYIRTWLNHVYEADGKEDDGYGAWVGIYVPSEDRMDEVEEPEEDEE